MADVISWDKAIDRKVKTTDDKDIGKVQSITTDYIQTKEGTMDKKYYYLPKYYLQGYDGNDLRISITKDEVKSRFEGEKALPSSTRQRLNTLKGRQQLQNNILILRTIFQRIAGPLMQGQRHQQLKRL
jgi:hypothetical protein